MITLLQATRMWLLSLVLFGFAYPFLVWIEAQVLPNHPNDGFVRQVGQQFNALHHFWGRPSAVAYNAASTGGSNQGPTNPLHLALVKSRMDSILKYHPYLVATDIPTEWVTASGSGLDPHISYSMAMLQVKRVAQHTGLSETTVEGLLQQCLKKAIIGPDSLIILTQLNQLVDSKHQSIK